MILWSLFSPDRTSETILSASLRFVAYMRKLVAGCARVRGRRLNRLTKPLCDSGDRFATLHFIELFPREGRGHSRTPFKRIHDHDHPPACKQQHCRRGYDHGHHDSPFMPSPEMEEVLDLLPSLRLFLFTPRFQRRRRLLPLLLQPQLVFGALPSTAEVFVPHSYSPISSRDLTSAPLRSTSDYQDTSPNYF
jgi:hypothetical protein